MRNTRVSRAAPRATRVEAEARRLRAVLTDLARRQCLRDPVAALCEEGQLTPPQVHAVLWLGEDGALTMGELARRLGITEKTITGLADRLAARGWLERLRDPADRRVVRARLTEAGEAVFRRLDRHLQERLEGLVAALDPADWASLRRILEKLSPATAQVAGAAAPGARARRMEGR